jgi:hypothetical protein
LLAFPAVASIPAVCWNLAVAGNPAGTNVPDLAFAGIPVVARTPSIHPHWWWTFHLFFTSLLLLVFLQSLAILLFAGI